MSGDLVVDFDPDVWVLLDPDGDLDGWASATAARCWREAGQPAGDPGEAVLGTQLLYLAERLADEPALVLLHLRHVELGPVTAALISSFDAGDGSEASLGALLGVDDPRLVEPATTERLDSPLGQALRARRFLVPDDGEAAAGPVLVSLGYAWHVPMVDRDIRLSTVSFELGEMAVIEPDIDALAQVVRVEL